MVQRKNVKRSGAAADRKVTRVRNLVIAFVALVVVALTLYGTLYSQGVAEGEFVAGTHYRILDEPVRQRAGAPIEVLEFFSYGCVHCRNFDPMIDRWQADLAQDVEFRRQPADFGPIWHLLGRTYLTLDALGALEQNHERLFRAIHDNGRQFLSEDMVADYVDGNGTDKATFLARFKAPDLARQASNMRNLQTRYGIQAVPTLTVAGKYVVSTDHGRRTALDIVDHLIDKEREARTLQSGP